MTQPWRRWLVFASIELDSLPVILFRNTNFFRQAMEPFGIDQWAENDHLFCGADPNGLIVLEVTVPHTARFDISLYATLAPDFAIIGVWWDGQRLGGDLDLYAPIVIPTDGMALGSLHVRRESHAGL